MELDVANPSYKVDLNIPAECAKYKIIVKNNVCDLTCKSGLTTRLLNNRNVTKTIDSKASKVVFEIIFTPEEAHIYNYLLDRSDLTIGELFDTIRAAHGFFLEYDITCKSQTTIDRYINTLGQFNRTWTGLTSKPDYNLTIFSNRMLPYFSLECMDWVKANLDTLKGDYPAELLEARKRHESANGQSKDDYHEEMNLATKNNNFLEWQVLPLDKYPNMDELINRIKLLKQIGLKRQAIIMICRLLLSPRECHIIRRPDVWEILKPEMAANKDFDILIKYCMYYAMYILKQEETIMFSQVNNMSRVLFTLEEANKLPTLDNCHIDRSPYIVQLTNDTPLSQTMPFYLHGKRRLNTSAEFQRRFHIATGGAFKGFDLKSIGAAITGSILIPCVHRSPLEDGFDDVDWVRERESIELKFPYMIDTPDTPEDEAFANYLEYYYPSYVSLTDEDYRKQVLGIGDKSKPNERQLIPEEITHDTLMYEDSGISEAPLGGIAKMHEIQEEEPKHEDDEEDKEDSQSEEDESKDKEDSQSEEEAPKSHKPAEKKNLTKKNLTKKSIRKLSKTSENLVKTDVPEQEEPKQNSTKEQEEPKQNSTNENKVLDPEQAENKTQRNATEYNQLADIDISITTRDQGVFKERALQLYEVIRKNCEHRGAVHIKEVKTIASIKYKIYGPGIPRPMDIFRIPYDPVKMVKKFHVHAVKMFYNGDLVMFRSCVACLLSGVGESYKWFSCNKVPADVLLKYAQRGISIILNSKEREAISKYIMSNNRWGNVITKLGIKPDKIYCCATAGHPFFRPGMYDCGIRLSLRRFERDASGLYANTLVVSQPRHVYPYGEVVTHTQKKIHMPDTKLITSILDYIENGETINGETNDDVENYSDAENDAVELEETMKDEINQELEAD